MENMAERAYTKAGRPEPEDFHRALIMCLLQINRIGRKEDSEE